MFRKPRLYTCGFCLTEITGLKFKTTSLGEWIKHCSERDHLVNTGKIVVVPPQYRCCICQHASDEMDFIQHLDDRHGYESLMSIQKPFKCSKCYYETKNKTEWMEHCYTIKHLKNSGKLVMLPVEFKCGICDHSAGQRFAIYWLI